MALQVHHLHTYFFFPFSVDRQAVVEDHPGVWTNCHRWIDGLDGWIKRPFGGTSSAVVENLGPWRRAAYVRADMDSPAYQDMVFFHPFARRVFFDTVDAFGGGEDKESLLRCYTIPLSEGRTVWLEAEDRKDRRARVQVTDLRLFLFANGIGVLSLGVEATHLSASEALWINDALRKVYPSSGRQVREGRIPSRVRLLSQVDGQETLLAEERFESGNMIGFLPPLSKTITALMYFADYDQEEFEPVLDERMIVYSYLVLDPASLPDNFLYSREYEVFLARFLYVDAAGSKHRYNPEFVRAQMERQVYSRWAHQGTYYGFTSYSNVTSTIGTFDCDDHELREGFLIHRMFERRYYLMAMVALFYRATLLDFAERTALVSKRLYLDQQDAKIAPETLQAANELRGEFLHFSNYWHFEELANKDEEIEHFTLMCEQYRVGPMKAGIEREIDALDAALRDYYQSRSTEAVNRLAMLSMILGAGAVVTGFFGMNFGHVFDRLFFQPDRQTLPVYYMALALVVVMAFGAIAFGLFVVVRNWSDYRAILVPQGRERSQPVGSLKRGPTQPPKAG
jgi:hypothetical protein